MASKGRVQVTDISGPPTIRVPDVSISNYARPAMPAEDRGWEVLAAGLGAFSHGLKSFQKQQEVDDRPAKLAYLEQWRAARTNTEALEAIKRGEAPTSSDLIVQAAMDKMHGEILGEKLISDLDKRLMAEEVPNFGRDNFDPDAFVVQAAGPLMGEVKNKPHATLALATALDHQRKALRSAHERALGQRNIEIFETKAYDDMRRIWEIAKSDIQAGKKVSGQTIMNAMRGTDGPYHAYGPRVRGGSFDLKHTRLDQLAMKSAEDAANDETLAPLVAEFLTTARTHEDGAQSTLSDGQKYQEAFRITNKARLTQFNTQKAGVEAQFRASVYENFRAGRGDYNSITDQTITSPLAPGKPIDLRAEPAKKEAELAFLENKEAEAKAALDKGDTKKAEAVKTLEIETFVHNDRVHPKDIPMMKGMFGGLGTIKLDDTKSFTPDVLENVGNSSVLFDRYNRINPEYLKKNLGEKAYNFYDGYSALVEMGYTPQDAIRNAAIAGENLQDDAARLGRSKEAFSLTTEMNLSVNRSWGTWLWSYINTHEVENPEEVTHHIGRRAAVLMKIDGISKEDALERAAKAVEKNTIMVNGRAVFSRHLRSSNLEELHKNFESSLGQEDAIESILGEIADVAYNRDILKNQGVTAQGNLTIREVGDGRFGVFIKGDDEAIGRPLKIGHPKDPKRTGDAIFTIDDINKRLAQLREREFADNVLKPTEAALERAKYHGPWERERWKETQMKRSK